MSAGISSQLKRRLTSSPERPVTTTKKSCDLSRREYGATFATGNAFVHNGDYLQIHQGIDPFQYEVHRIQATLAYPGMHDRFEQLKEAAEGTFKWILTPTDTDANDPVGDKATNWKRQKMATFIEWYKDGIGPFWISGKPGSGKSTLMKYLVEHIASTGTLSDNHGLVTLSFFFWIGGHAMSRSKLGCLKSLLWQLLEDFRTQQVAVQVCQSHFRNNWTESRLQQVLLTTLKQLGSPAALFIDGLDEGLEHDELLRLLDSLIVVPDLKICVSSRPEATLATRLQVCPHISLQELNAIDIQTLVWNKFSANLIKPRGCAEVEELVQRIQFRSEGVFLWAHLVVKDLLKGINNGDEHEMLLSRIDRLPSDITDLYEDMLRRSGDAAFYKQDAARYFALALHREFSLFQFCFAMDDRLRQEYMQASNLEGCPDLRSDVDCEIAKKRIVSRTAGLLDVVPFQHTERWAQEDDLRVRTYRHYRIVFTHRTAIDFVQSTHAGKSLLDPSTNTDERISRICRDSDFVCGLVVPILTQKALIPRRLGLELTRCRQCPDEYTYTQFDACILEFLQSLVCAGRIELDEDYAIKAAMWYSYRGNESPLPFPSTQRGKIDPVPIFLQAYRYGIAKRWLIEHGCLADKKYLSTLLSLIYTDAARFEDFAEGWDLMEFLVQNGAVVHEIVQLKTGETFRLLQLLSFECSKWLYSQESQTQILSIVKCSVEDLAIHTTTLCYRCHSSWFDAKEIEADKDFYDVWGTFCTMNIDTLGFAGSSIDLPASGESVLRPEDDHVSVLSRKLRPSTVPEVFLLSESRSRLLIEMLQDREGSLSEVVAEEGIAVIRDPTYAPRSRTSSSSGIQYLDRFCADLPTASFAEAMEHMGKPRQIVENFYEQEARRMMRRPPRIQEGWKEWFWGSEASLH